MDFKCLVVLCKVLVGVCEQTDHARPNADGEHVPTNSEKRGEMVRWGSKHQKATLGRCLPDKKRMTGLF